MEDVGKILSHFNINNVKAVNPFLWDGWSSHKLYLIETEKERYLLKSKKQDHSESLIKASNITNYLHDAGLPFISQPIRTKHNKLFYTDADNNWWELQTYMEGSIIPAEETNEKHVTSLAKALASYHKLFIDQEVLAKSLFIPKSTEYTYDFRDEKLEKERNRYANILSQELLIDTKRYKNFFDQYVIAFEKIQKLIKNINPTEHKKTLIHRDLGGNVLFNKTSKEVAAIIDWDLAQFGDLVVDICAVSGVIKNSLNDLFIESYDSYIKLSEQELKFIPVYKYMSFVKSNKWWITYNIKLLQNEDVNGEQDREKILKNIEETFDLWDSKLSVLEKAGS